MIQFKNYIIKLLENCLKIENLKLKIALCFLFFFFIFAHRANAGLIIRTPSNLGLSTGLVGYWRMDSSDISGTTLSDKSGQGNNGTVTGATPTVGKISQGMSFDGSDDLVNITNPGSVLDGKNLTISAWIYPKRSSTSYPRIIDRVYNGQFAFYIADIGFRSLSWALCTTGGCVDHGNGAPSNSINFNQWQHVVLTWDGTNVSTYVNNVLIETYGAGLSGGLSNSTYNIRIGQRVDAGSNRDFNGSIDDVRIYNRALSAGEIKRLYNMGAGTKTGKSPSTGSGPSLSTGLVGYWTFDQNKIYGTQAYDSSSSYATGTISGATPIEGKLGQAMSFDGASNYISFSKILNISPYPTFNLWFKTADTRAYNSGGVIFYGYGSDNGGIHFCVGGSKICLAAAGTSGKAWSWSNTCGTKTVSDNQWHHLSMKVDGTGIYWYVDGVFDGSDTSYTGTMGNIGSGSGTIGYRSGYGFFSGPLDDFRIYNRALSQAEITQLYNIGVGTKTGKSPSTSSGSSLSTGLVGYWTMDEKDVSGTTMVDKSPVGTNSATLVNAPGRIEGKIGQAFSFNGSSQYLVLPATAFPGYPTSGSTSAYNFSFAAWFKTTSNGLIFAQDDATQPQGSPSGWVPALYVDTAGRLRASVFWHGATTYQINPTTVVNNGKWHHVVDTYTNGTESLYLDGVLVGQQSYSETGYSANYSYFIGTGYANSWPNVGASWFYFNGSIDDARVYNRALSAEEVKRLYNLGR